MTTIQINDLVVTVHDLELVLNVDDSDMVVAKMRIEHTASNFTVDYQCSEFVDDGVVNDTADSHLSVNGIWNSTYGFRQPIVDYGSGDDDRAEWMKVETFIRNTMQSFVDQHFKKAA